MLAKALKNNHFFVPLGILLVVTLLWAVQHSGAVIDGASLFTWGMMACCTALATLLIYQSEVFKKTYFFLFFLGIWLFSLHDITVNLSFYGGMFFLLIGLIHLLVRGKDTFSFLNAFDIGFFLGMAVILHPSFWVFLVYALLHYFITGNVDKKSAAFWSLGLIAVVLIWLQLTAVLNLWDYVDFFIDELQFSILSPFDLPIKLWALLPVLLLTGFSVYIYFKNLYRHTPSKRHFYSNMILLLICGLIYVGLYGNDGTAALLPLGLPISVFLANYLYKHKGNFWLTEIWAWIYLICFTVYVLYDKVNIPLGIFERITF